MVRRRQRASKTTPVEQNLVNGKTLNHVLEDHFFASPKRKDCKIESNSSHNEMKTACTYANNNEKKTTNSRTGAKSKHERIIGVPLATRSQTRTIENFFKNNAKLKAAVAGQQSPNNNHNNNNNNNDELALENTNECYFDLCDEDTTNDTDTTEYSDEPQVAFEFHACPNHNNDNNNNTNNYNLTADHVATCENIFLQEPVLKLQIDETLRHTPLSKGLELKPIFSSPSSLNGRFNKIVSLNGQQSTTIKREGFESPSTKVAFMLPDNDNSSCDSGVAFSAHSVGNSSPTHSQINACALPLFNNNCGITISNRRRKPTTPHRIVCPSPVKSMPVLVSTFNNSNNNIYNKTHANGHVMSPRKSQRNYAMPVATGAHSNKPPRRRLNHQYQQYNHETEGDMGEEVTVATAVITTTKINNKTAMNKMKKNGMENLIKLEIDCCNRNENIKKQSEEQNQHLDNKDELKSITAKTECADSLEFQIGNISDNQRATDEKLSTLKMKAKNDMKPSKATQQNKMKQSSSMGLTNNGRNREISDFFPVRRSVRKTKTAVKEEMMHQLEQAILEEREDGLRTEYFDGKGRGVVTERQFQRGEFVVEYVGDLITMSEAAEREKRYALDENAGCYMYYFKHKNQQYCIDATADTGKLGRLVNHSRNGNLMTKVVVVKQRPHLILVAKDDIEAGDELCYDYGDRSKESLLHHPWLAL